MFDDLAQFKYPTGNSRHLTLRDDSSSDAAESTAAHQSKGTPRNDDDWINFDELQRDPRQFNPFADVDVSELVKDLVKYDISSDSDSYDDGSSDERAARPLSRNNIDEYISAAKEDEDYIQQLHFEDPEALGVLCSRDEWNATRYLGVALFVCVRESLHVHVQYLKKKMRATFRHYTCARCDKQESAVGRVSYADVC